MNVRESAVINTPDDLEKKAQAGCSPPTPVTPDRAGLSNRLSIGLLTHSTNPRGGVVHVLELASALSLMGQKVVVYAPDENGRGFFRPVPAGVSVALFPARRTTGGLAALVRQRINEYVTFLAPRIDDCDLYHAHDGISGSALANLVDAGTLPGFVRTVHHMDDFDDPFLSNAQTRSITRAGTCICVSRMWADALDQGHGISAAVIPNGVDLRRFSAQPLSSDRDLISSVLGDAERPDGGDRSCSLSPVHKGEGWGEGPSVELRGIERNSTKRPSPQPSPPPTGEREQEWSPQIIVTPGSPIFLAVGGVERRKNTVNILRAFLLAKQKFPHATLRIVGGASLLDHSDYRREFDHALSEADAPSATSIHLIGPVPDEAMPALYRRADALVFPSITEGFGLAVLEAMACGTPVVTSRIAPFTEYLSDADAMLVNPHDTTEIAAAMCKALDPNMRICLRAAGFRVASRFPWQAAATAHVELYKRFLEHFSRWCSEHPSRNTPRKRGGYSSSRG